VTRHLIIAVMLLAGSAPAAFAQSRSSSSEQRLSLEEATRLTWRTDSRAMGVSALRRIAAEAPDDVNARFELGRVLTWDLRTRGEGVEMLRSAAAAAPERGDIAEALGDVLSWNDATRPEAVSRLRGLLEREPHRTATRLKLADVLSWNPTTRDEARRLYIQVLADDEGSVGAAVGLGRVFSWNGQFAESRTFYQLALSRDPADQSARVGIAELDGWTGRARASLKTLAAYPAGVIETPNAMRLRAQAYSQIGRPATALRHYDALLALEPGNRSALQASRRLRQSIRPVLEIGADGGDESGDYSTDRVRTSSVPLRFSFYSGDAKVSVLGNMAAYRNATGTSRDTSLGAAADVPLGHRVRMSGDLIGHEFDVAERTFTGHGQFEVALHDGFDVRAGIGREQLWSSRLSLAGEQALDVFYGPSFVEQVSLGATARPGAGWDLWAQGTKGRIRGLNITDNNREELFAGAGRAFHPGVVTIRPGYSLSWMSYDRDLGGFPSTDLAGDGLSARGVGGYFSPFRFLNQMARVDLTVPASDALLIVGGAGVGRQQVEDTLSHDFSYATMSSDAYIGLRVNAGNRVSIGAQMNYQDVASSFDRTGLRLTLAYGF
jgi:tetratricopeptide (TPR) repeat protein